MKRVSQITKIVAQLMLIVSTVGCVPHKKPLHLAPMVTVEFRGVHDGRCEIRDVELDAKTGNQVVICK